MRVEEATTEKLCADYVKIRDYLRDRKAARVKTDEPYLRAMAEIECELNTRMLRDGVESYKTASGCAYLMLSPSISVIDRAAFLSYIRTGELWDLVEIRPIKSEIKALVDEAGVAPRGLKYEETRVVRVRKV